MTAAYAQPPPVSEVDPFCREFFEDPRHWERPDDYDITRRAVGHVDFGSGIHQCVGQLLARLEGECVLSALARKAGSIEITGPIRRRYNNTLRALASLPVTVRPA